MEVAGQGIWEFGPPGERRRGSVRFTLGAWSLNQLLNGAHELFLGGVLLFLRSDFKCSVWMSDEYREIV